MANGRYIADPSIRYSEHLNVVSRLLRIREDFAVDH